MADDPTTPVPDPVKDTRQPVVTSIGIILGFLLNFLAQWAIREDGESAIQDATDWVIVVTLLLAVTMMVVVLFRMLVATYPVEESVARYRSIIRLYMVAISLVFVGMGIALFV